MESESESEVLRCVECNVEFVQTQKTRLYCSRSCQILRNNRIQREKLRADPDYALKRHKKYAEQRGGEATRKCDHCGEEFSTLDRRKRFCSRRCKERTTHREWVGRNLEHLREYYASTREHRNKKAMEWVRKNPERWAATQQRVYEKRKIQTPWKALVDGARSRTRLSDIPFNLTDAWAKDRWTGKCELTGIPFDTERRKGTSRIFWPSIDRIDPKRGYVTDNCRIILHAVNAMKGEGSDADMLLIAKAIVASLCL